MTRRNELLAALQTPPRDLARALRGIPPPAHAVRPAPDQWSLSDVVNHLLFVEVRYLARLQRVAQGDLPLIPYIHPDETQHDLAIPLEELLARFTAARTQTLTFLQPLPSKVWAARAVFDTGQTATFRSLVQTLVEHDTAHLSQIVTIKNLLTLP